jgi:hypothetical protein
MAEKAFAITGVEVHDPNELFERMRKVTMLSDREARPYENARLTLKKMRYPDISPAQRYVLTENLLRTRHLEWELEKLGHDLFDINGYLTLRTDLSDEPVDLLPPIVERTPEDDGTHHNVINDGMHRLFNGRLEWKLPTVLHVEDVPKEYPYYAYPIPGPFPWDNVVVLDGNSVPPGFIKKWHRIRDNKLLYRDFNSAFRNVGGPRGGGRVK